MKWIPDAMRPGRRPRGRQRWCQECKTWVALPTEDPNESWNRHLETHRLIEHPDLAELDRLAKDFYDT